MKDKQKEAVVICGARSCTFNKDSKCRGLVKGIITVISVDGTCIRFDSVEEK